MGKIISFSNKKGGVGKTTTCLNLSAYLALRGKRVLVVDLDPQGNSSTGLGVNKTKLKGSSFNLLTGEYESLTDLIHKTPVKNLFVIPANSDLDSGESYLGKQQNRDKILPPVIAQLAKDVDYVMIDCPPSIALMTINAMASSDKVIIPIQTEFYALEGLAHLMNAIKIVTARSNPRLTLDGVVLTMYSKSLMADQVMEEVKRLFGAKMYDTVIPRNVRLAEAPSHGVPIPLHDPRSSGAKAYEMLCEEFLRRNEIRE